MSKNISIAEGGTSRQFTNDKLKINLVGGGTEYYVPESGVQLTTKNVTANGTYKASDVGKYGFSQFSVNVRGGNGSAGSDGKPNTSGSGPLPGGSGSAVVGTDPETGNDVAVGVDENGNLVQTPVPSAIQIVTPPTKTSYVYQETMDYAGIVVAAKNKDGTTFTDARYMNGHIPMGELIFPVDKAPAAGGSSGGSTAYTVVQNETFTRDGAVWAVNVLNSTARAVRFIFSDIQDICYVSDSPYRYSSQYLPGGFYSEHDANAVQINGKTYYCGGGINALPGSTLTMSQEIAISDTFGYASSNLTSNEFWALCVEYSYGEKSGGDLTATIPVQWKNPYTGATHQDTFEITSTPSSGSSSTTTGSSSTEGSGGGGSF